MHARGAGDWMDVLMSDHCCGIIIVVVAWEDEMTSINLPIPDDGILPYAAIAPRDQDRMAAMRPALRYTPLNPAGQGYFPGIGEGIIM